MSSDEGSLNNARTGKGQEGPEMLVPGNVRKAHVPAGWP